MGLSACNGMCKGTLSPSFIFSFEKHRLSAFEVLLQQLLNLILLCTCLLGAPLLF